MHKKIESTIPFSQRPFARVSECQNALGLSRGAVVKLATEIGAVHKLGARTILIDVPMLLDAIEDADRLGQARTAGRLTEV